MKYFKLDPIHVYGDKPRPTFLPMLILFCFQRCKGCGRNIDGFAAYWYPRDWKSDFRRGMRGCAYHIECLGTRVGEAAIEADLCKLAEYALSAHKAS